MEISFRRGEGAQAQPLLLWDSLWDIAEGRADWALAAPGEPGNAGGLRARAVLETAIVLALFTDRRCPDDHPLRAYAGDDPRGWWGDGIDLRADLGETELGSLLWLLERAALTVDVPLWAKSFADEALAPLIAQGAAARIDVTVEADNPRARLDLLVEVYGRDGARIYDQKFQVLWTQR